MRKISLILAISACLVGHVYAKDATDDLAYRAALYDYSLGEYAQAKTTLLRQEQVQTQAYQLLLARIYVEQGRYQQAQEIFERAQFDKVADQQRDEVLYSLAELEYSQQQCANTLKAIQEIKKVTQAQEPQLQYMKASCLVLVNATEESVRRAAKVLQDGAAKMRDGDEGLIWYGYGFYNVAIAASKLKNTTLTDNLFQQALGNTGKSREGFALTEQIRLTQARITYDLNRYDYAMKIYEEIPLNGYWQDEALLGYGWAAFRNFQPDVAQEAWRQLMNLPFTSMSVYQSYVLIPYAYERANAFVQALRGYDHALKEYTRVSAEIDRFRQQLTPQKIQQHAVLYYKNKGENVAPLHPLLTAIYAQQEFRDLIEYMGVLAQYQDYVVDKQAMLAMLVDYRQQHQTQANTRKQWQNAQQERTRLQLMQADARLPEVLDEVLASAFASAQGDASLTSVYQRYLQLKRQVNKSQEGAAKRMLAQRLQAIQGALYFSLVESKKEVAQQQALLNVSQRLHHAHVRYQEYLVIAQQHFESPVTDAAIRVQQNALDEAKAKIDAQFTVVQTQLFEKTQTALERQKNIIENYKNQARVSSTNLKEELYQRGGSKLWY